MHQAGPRGGCTRDFVNFRNFFKKPYKPQLALYCDEVRILIFDDPAELYDWQRPEFSSTQLYSIVLDLVRHREVCVHTHTQVRY